MRHQISLAFAIVTLAACSGEISSDVDGGTIPVVPSTLAGDYKGPEGMFVTVTPSGEGAYRLDMRWGLDDDMAGTFDGQAYPEGIAFQRNGDELVLRLATGDETGLKWLAGKNDCLMVELGKGYCKD